MTAEVSLRTRVCLQCRTAYGEDETCPAKRHETISIKEDPGRKKLDDEVWGPDSRARALRRMAKAGAGGGAAGGILKGGCGGCDVGGLEGCSSVGELGEAALVILAIVAVGLVAIVLTRLIWKLIVYIRMRRDQPKPHGALLRPPKIARKVHAVGTVKTGQPSKTPWKAGSCLAYAMELHKKNLLGGGAMRRDAATAGIEIALDDGRVMRVPAGRIRLLGRLAKQDVDKHRLLDSVDLAGHLTRDGREFFPYDHTLGLTLKSGDRVEVLGQIELAADPGAAGGYRASAGVVVPVGVPVLRVQGAGAPPDARLRIADDGDAGAEAEAAEEEAEREAAEAAAREPSDRQRAPRP